MNLTEAFKALNALNEDTFSVSDDGIAKLAEFQDNDDLTDEVRVIDPDAETEDELLDSYVGKVILDCEVCHSKLYKDAADVELNEDGTLANVSMECPYCYSTDGYKILGQVAEYSEEPAAEETNSDDAEEKVTESLNESWASDVEEAMDSGDEYFMDDLYSEFADKAFALVEKQGFTDVFAEPSTQMGQGGDFFWANKDGVSYRGSYDFETEQEAFWEAAGSAQTRAQAIQNCAKVYAQIILSSLKPDDEEELEEGIFGFGKKSKSKPAAGSRSSKESQVTISVYDENGTKQFSNTFKELPGKMGAVEQFNELIKSNGVLRAYKSSPKKSDWSYERKSNPPSPYDTDKYFNSAAKIIREALDESVNNVNVETDDSTVSINTDDSGRVTVTTEPKSAPAEGDEFLAPIDDETQAQIEAGNPETEMDVDIDTFDEGAFDELGESFFKGTYDNVKGYKTTNISEDVNGLLLVEGVITFDSGARKATQFVFEGKDITRKGKARLVGENLQLTKGKKAFTLSGQISNGHFIAESFNYNFRTTSDGKSTRVYGTKRR